MRKRWFLFFLVIVVIAGAILLVLHRKAQLRRTPLPREPLLSVQAVPVTHGTFLETDLCLGVIRPKVVAEMAPMLTARILSVGFRQGDPVRKGEVLALLHDRPQKHRIAALRAERDAARTAFSTQEAVWGRDRELFDAKALSREALDRSEALAEAAKAKLAGLNRALEIARTELSYTRLTAPFDLGRSGCDRLPGHAAQSLS